MASLTDTAELVGFFSYSRDDDEDSHGALSALRERIQRELRGQLGRTTKNFRLWQDKESISFGKLWEAEIKVAVKQAMFFIPIITPTVIRSKNCRFEIESFLAREAQLGRNDLVFPILYIRVPELEDVSLHRSDSVLSMIAKRQYLDWRELRHRDVTDTVVKEAVERFCAKICEILRQGPPSEERRAQQQAATLQRLDQEKTRREADRIRPTGSSKSIDALDAASSGSGSSPRSSGSFPVHKDEAAGTRTMMFGVPNAKLLMIAGGAALAVMLIVWGSLALFANQAPVGSPSAKGPGSTDQPGGPHHSALTLPENDSKDPTMMIAPPQLYPGR
jgi:hypothetical protein